MCDIAQCCAPSNSQTNERCPNPIVCESHFHCETHYGPARKLYRDYKLACTTAEKCDLARAFGPDQTAQEITYVNECYKSLIRAYDGRMKHRRYGFCPETWDEGHQTQFRLLKTRIDLFETRLDALYERQKREFKSKELEQEQHQELQQKTIDEKDSEDDDSKSLVTSSSSSSSFRNVAKFRRQRAADNAEVDRLLQKYIADNKRSIAERQKMFRLTLNVLHSYIPKRPERMDEKDEDDYDTEDEDEELDNQINEYLQLVGVYRMARKLYEIDYFRAEYKPPTCQGCKCGRAICQYMKLSCGCAFKYSSLSLYLKRMNLDWMKLITTILLKHKNRIQPLVDDYLFLLKVYGPQALVMKTKLEWCSALKRLKFKEDLDSAPPITSKWVAQFRKPGYIKNLRAERSKSAKALVGRTRTASKGFSDTALVESKSSLDTTSLS
jgi:hypothetical protein